MVLFRVYVVILRPLVALIQCTHNPDELVQIKAIRVCLWLPHILIKVLDGFNDYQMMREMLTCGWVFIQMHGDLMKVDGFNEACPVFIEDIEYGSIEIDHRLVLFRV